MSDQRQDPVDIGRELASLLLHVPPERLIAWVGARPGLVDLAAELRARRDNPYEIAKVAADRLKWHGSHEALLGDLAAAFPDQHAALAALAGRLGVPSPVAPRPPAAEARPDPPPGARETTPVAELSALLGAAFEPDELRAWLIRFPWGAELVAHLPAPPASRAQVATAAATGLEARQTLDARFFGELHKARPGRKAEIDALAARYGLPPASAPPAEAPPAPPEPVTLGGRRLAAEEMLSDARRARIALLERQEDTAAIDAEIRRLTLLTVTGEEPREGLVLSGRYKLEEELGGGHFASVWRAFDREMGRRVAVKLLVGKWARDPSRRERFARGAAVMAELRHPGLVRVLAPVVDDGERSYFVMELMPGGDLHRALAEGRIGRRAALGAVLEAAVALAYAWETRRGPGGDLVHRDIKPHNILLDGAGHARLTDFDLVHDPDVLSHTRTTLGTPAYMAPEQWTGAGAVDARTDVHGLGATMLYCLAGDDAVRSLWVDRAGTLARVDAPGPVRQVLERALALDPARRQANPRAFCQELEAALRAWDAAEREVAAAPEPEPVVAVEPVVDRGPEPAVEAVVESAPEPVGAPGPLVAPRPVVAPDLAAPGAPLRRPRGLGRLLAGGTGVLAVAALGLWALAPEPGGPTSRTPAVGSDPPGPVVPTPEAGDPAAKTWTTRAIPDAPMTFVGLKDGRFRMGSPDGDGDGQGDERPQHWVNVSGFLVGQSEVTQAQWSAVVRAAKAAGDAEAAGLEEDPSSFKGETRPVERVSWCEAARFANALSRLQGLTPAYTVGADCEEGGDVAWDRSASGFRLPTEAEWEYAARAGTSTAYATGDTEADLARAGWTSRNSGSQTHPVCTAAEKPWGLCDLHGNVWEWTWDWYAPYQSAEVGNPAGPSGGVSRVLRSGSWYDTPGGARSALRYWDRPSGTYVVVGFRLALSAVPSER